MSDSPSRAPAERLLLVIDLLCRALGGRVTRPGRPGLPDALLVLIWSRLRRLGGRITRLAAKIDAGISPARPRRRTPRPRESATPPPGPPPVRPPPVRLPRDRGWLIRLVGYEAAGGRSQLRHLLAQPEMAPLLADPRMIRLLRPLCHMLGITLPTEVAKPLPRPGPATPPCPVTVPTTPPAAAPPAPPPRPAAAAPLRRATACGPPPLPA